MADMSAKAQLDRLEKRLKRIPEFVKQASRPALQKSGDELASTMRGVVPVLTGRLRDSIQTTVGPASTPPHAIAGGVKDVPEGSAVVTAGDSGARHARLVEFGTRAAPAQPYFWPVWRMLKKRLQRRLKAAMGKAVRDGWKGGS